MKWKFLLIMIVALMTIVPGRTFAVEIPDVSSGRRYFDYSSGCEVFSGNVYVHWKKRNLTITASEAKAQLMSQKVWASGNINLTQGNMTFKCDNIFVRGKDRTVDILGSVNFLQNNIISITSNVAQFSWKSKMADFYGNVKVNVLSTVNISSGNDIYSVGSSVNGTYDHVQYNVRDNTIILLDKNFANIPNMTFPEPDPTENRM